MDTLVFDIETQNFFTDPDVGWNNFGALKISVVGIYSYAKDAYVAFEEDEMEKLAEFFRNANRLVGFSMNRYDVPVLQNYFRKQASGDVPDLWKKERIDLLEEIEMATGHRIGLGKLAQANLGMEKIGHGAEAIELYKNGRMDELKAYCLKDVEITKRLFDLYVERGYFLIPERDTGEAVKVFVGLSHDEKKKTSLF